MYNVVKILTKFKSAATVFSCDMYYCPTETTKANLSSDLYAILDIMQAQEAF